MSDQIDAQKPKENFAISDWYSWVDAKRGSVVLDGGLGSILSERGNNLSQGSMWSGRLLHTNPEELRAVAQNWLAAGADIISTATYQVSEQLFQKEFGLSDQEAEVVISSAYIILDGAREKFWSSLTPPQRTTRRYPKIAVSFGPFSAVRDDTDEYSGLYDNVSPDEFRHFHDRRSTIFARLLGHLDTPHSYIMCYETIGNLSEGVAIAETMSGPELRNVPFWMSFQCRDASQLASGASLSSAVHAVLRVCRCRNLVAMGVNCVDIGHVKDLMEIVERSVDSYMASPVHQSWRVDTIAYPNSGESWSNDGWSWPTAKPIVPTLWASLVCSSGAKIVGGCCRTSPAHISALDFIRDT